MTATIFRDDVEYRVVDRTDGAPALKVCRRCGDEKPVNAFPVKRWWRHELKTPTVYVGYDSFCIECRPKYAKEYYDREKPTGKWNLSSRKSGLKRNYGMSEEEYDDLLEEQGGGCAICGCEDGGLHAQTGKQKRLAVDHDEKTGIVRGLLCSNHNMAIGLFGHDPDLLTAAAAYLICSEDA